ncbi:MAG: hypothetical protein U5N86_03855 [Planctomycetota bacterium]|nr:hypothetical protein [Planctomycetota bacterium]
MLDRVSVLGSDFLPSAWMTNLVDSAASADWAEYGYNLFMLSANALLLVHLALILGWLLLRPAREMVASSSSTVRYRSNGTFAKFFRSALFMLDESMREMVLKDVKTFSRSPGQWTQVLIFFGLLAFYIFNLRTFNYHIQGEYWKNIISYSNLTAIGLVLASFTGRFVFPLISLEGSRIWVLGLSPVPRSKIVMAKFWFSFIGSMSVSVLLVIASDLMLDLSFGTIVIHVSTMMLVCAGLSGLAVGLGSIFPNFEEDNPSRIISGFGGTINLVFSLAYVILTVFSVSLPYRLIPGALGNLLGLLAVGFAAVLAVFAAVIPMRIGIRTFEKTEF